ncbi:ribosomal protein S5 domain 2-type protein, partial [Myxozyma melibiosi]
SDIPPSTPATTTSFLFRADGSASWKVGSAHLLASVSGPMEVSKRDEEPTTAALEVVLRPDVGLSSPREQYLQDRIRKALTPVIILDLNPRTLIQLVIQIVESGDLQTHNRIALAAAINAAYLALLDAGIPMRSTLKGGAVERLLMSENSGMFSTERLFECYEIAAKVCVETNGVMREVVAKGVERLDTWRK